MRRRNFIALLGGAAAWPLAARAQQAPSGCGGSACSSHLTADDPEGHARITAFAQGLQEAGWSYGPQRADRLSLWVGQVRTTFADTRQNWSRSRRTSFWPSSAATVAPDLQGDPHHTDRVRAALSIRSAPALSLAWRGRAATPPALSCCEYSMSAKWLELLKEIAPHVTRVAVITGRGQFRPESASSARYNPWRRRSGWRCTPVDVRDAGEIERAVTAFARSRMAV